ncbi:MAG: hypothetical protein AAF196_04015 [Planctomycetota bacterium]
MSLRSKLFVAIVVTAGVGCRSVEPQPAESVQASAFPDDFVGLWRGPCEIWRFDGSKQELEMEFEVALVPGVVGPTRYRWTLRYLPDSGPVDERNYELLFTDDPGRFVVDERNGIRLDSFWLGDRLVSRFEVRGTLLESVTRRIGGTVELSIVTGPVEPSGESGGGEVSGVRGFALRTQQVARMQRVP